MPKSGAWIHVGPDHAIPLTQQRIQVAVDCRRHRTSKCNMPLREASLPSVESNMFSEI